jgi:hypothetical protein
MTPLELVKVCEDIVKRVDPSTRLAPFDPESEQGKMAIAFCMELLRAFGPGQRALKVLRTLNDYGLAKNTELMTSSQSIRWNEACREVEELLRVVDGD